MLFNYSVFFKTMATKIKLPRKCDKMVEYQGFEVVWDKLHCDQSKEMPQYGLPFSILIRERLIHNLWTQEQ